MEIEPLPWLVLIPLLPLLGAVANGIIALTARRSDHNPFVGLIACLAAGGSVVVSALALWRVAQSPGEVVFTQQLWSWFSVGSLELTLGLQVDRLSAIMLGFVTGIAFLIHCYSIGYMRADRAYARYMCFLNLFLASMVILVLGDSLPATFLGWEGVGLCSYLLIGFWYQDEANNNAARKAFIMNRVGDLGFIAGTAILMLLMGEQASLSYAAINAWAPGLGEAPALLGVATLLFFLACCGKSAQIPLFTWLPDAMAGPTPVSALIHAATMVTAGVYLMARLAPVMVMTPMTLDVILLIATATALYAGVCALVQWDIKKVLAYSTVSQLGFMFMAVGVGAFDVALFHVFTHAFFKATLFLGAGSIIHVLHHEQDMRRMGGLSKTMPWTYAACFFAYLSIIGFPLTAGFFSKDLIIERLFQADGLGAVVGILALVGALLTAFYMTRLMYLVFWSPSRVAHPESQREAPLVMGLPVLLLGIGSLIAGIAWAEPLVAFMETYLVLPPDTFHTFGDDLDTHFQLKDQYRSTMGVWLQPILGDAQDRLHLQLIHPSFLQMLWMALPGVVALVIGAVLARLLYLRGPGTSTPAPLRGVPALLSSFFDRVYLVLVVVPLRITATTLDVLCEGIGLPLVQGLVAHLIEVIGNGYRCLQQSKAQISLASSLVALVVVLIVALWPILMGA